MLRYQIHTKMCQGNNWSQVLLVTHPISSTHITLVHSNWKHLRRFLKAFLAKVSGSAEGQMEIPGVHITWEQPWINDWQLCGSISWFLCSLVGRNLRHSIHCFSKLSSGVGFQRSSCAAAVVCSTSQHCTDSLSAWNHTGASLGTSLPWKY